MSQSSVRLHITPFAPDAITAVLGTTLATSAQNISYHSLQTFPENNYGYVDLSTMDAEKVKKRLNGAIVKGRKVKVEEARPKKRSHMDADNDLPSNEVVEAEPRSSKRTKKDSNVLSAQQLSPDRKVKRGWTETKLEQTKKKKDKQETREKQQTASMYTDKAELLFKTKIPSNKKDTEVSNGKKKKKKQDKSGSDVVHEFEHTTATPSFLRDSRTTDARAAVEYKDGQGWVDENGSLVEQETQKASRKRKAAKLGLEINVNKAQLLSQRQTAQKPPSPPSSKPASGTESDLDKDNKIAERITDIADETSSSGTSSIASESDHELTPVPQSVDPTNTAPEVHPLEALFKKPQLPTSQTASAANVPTTTPPSASDKDAAKPTLELNTAFSFFDPDVEEEENNVDISNNLPTMPMTPFSSQDFRHRTMRSAAPTPDTADPRISNGYGSLILGEDDSDEELSDMDTTEQGHDQTPTQPSSQPTSKAGNHLGLPLSDFEKRFWEQRGENNRAWKARRRAVLKEKRQRENRSRRPKAW